MEQLKPPDDQTADEAGSKSEDHDGGEVSTEHISTNVWPGLCLISMATQIKLHIFTCDADTGINFQQVWYWHSLKGV